MMILGLQRLTWISPLSSTAWWATVGVCMLGWLVLRAGWGRSLVSGRWGLAVLRAAVIVIAVAIAAGPTIVDEQPGARSRPTMYFLVDGSQSMQLGGETTRWKDCLDFLSEAERVAGADASGYCKSFRFGHRLSPLGDRAGGELTLTSMPSGALDPPDASDSRLADALRQLSPQMDPTNSAGLVLLSDGRVRATESVERLAEHFGKTGVPIHVVPVGELQGSGDVAIVSLVVEPRVRKYTENQLTLYLRSFGFAGQRTTVRILSRSKIAQADDVVLAELPITLSGGAQSASLTFRVGESEEQLTVVIDPLEGELTERNNRVQARVEIDRTKLRVLYLEGEVAGQQSLLRSLLTLGGTSISRPMTTQATNLRDALQADEDIECTVLIHQGNNTLSRINNDGIEAGQGFPKTRAELFAYDCIVLSNFAPDLLSEEQLQELTLWIEGRGGGLIITGAQSLRSTGWADHPLTPLLPIHVARLTTTFAVPTPITATVPDHPIWRLRLERASNEQLLATLPPLSIGVSGIEAKPSAEVLATSGEGPGVPVMVAHRAGRGRVLVSAAELGGSALTTLAENWGPQPERAAGKLWRNMVYWATEGSSVGRRRLVAHSDKRFYRPGERLAIDAVAYDEAARKSSKYQIWAMLEPMSLDDSTLYSPVLWPENVPRHSGEVGPRVAWGEELPLAFDPLSDQYQLQLMLSEASGSGDSGMRIEMTAYEGGQATADWDHGTQVDSTSLAIHVLSDPFEQQNPLPNRELLVRLATLSGGQVIEHPSDLAKLLQARRESAGPPLQELSPAWSHWWLWLAMIGLLTGEWIWRRTTGLA